jgi:hypothetical protein
MNTRQVHTVFLWNKTKYALGKRVWELVDWPCIMCVCVCVCVCVCIIIVNVWGSFRYQMAILSIGRRLFIASENRKGACSHGAAACALSLFYVCPIYIYIYSLGNMNEERLCIVHVLFHAQLCMVDDLFWVNGMQYTHTHTHTHVHAQLCGRWSVHSGPCSKANGMQYTHKHTHTHVCVYGFKKSRLEATYIWELTSLLPFFTLTFKKFCQRDGPVRRRCQRPYSRR